MKVAVPTTLTPALGALKSQSDALYVVEDALMSQTSCIVSVAVGAGLPTRGSDLTKPIRPAQLRDMVRHALAGNA